MIRVDVRDGKVVGGARRVKVARGSVVEIVITSDRSDEVHLHTYDDRVDVKAGGTARIRVTADITGVHECEFHDSELTLFRLQVQ